MRQTGLLFLAEEKDTCNYVGRWDHRNRICGHFWKKTKNAHIGTHHLFWCVKVSWGTEAIDTCSKCFAFSFQLHYVEPSLQHTEPRENRKVVNKRSRQSDSQVSAPWDDHLEVEELTPIRSLWKVFQDFDPIGFAPTKLTHFQKKQSILFWLR